MTKEDLIKEFDRLIEAHYDEEIDSRDEWLREIIDLKDNVVKKLTIPVVSNRREQLIAFEQWRRVQGFFANATATFKIVDEYLESN